MSYLVLGIGLLLVYLSILQIPIRLLVARYHIQEGNHWNCNLLPALLIMAMAIACVLFAFYLNQWPVK